ncbi:MAG: bifunctional 5,10-methylenetetrahydrofolate dehydrogenase/5,10-methenyltetrahydrofolate cyclohydrolase [Bacilli bacterium]
MIDIKKYVERMKNVLKEEIKTFKCAPHLVIIQVNDDPASTIYVGGKIRDADEVGIKTTLVKLPVDTTESSLIDVITKYNIDKTVHGIIVQLPLPKQINEMHIKFAVNPLKDVDGFHPLSKFEPCTPLGIVKLLKSLQFNFSGANAVIIGRSEIVGKPMAKLLLKNDCNVTMLHSKTKEEDKKFYIKHADLLVVAVGKKYFISDYELNPNAFIIDVGINRVDGQVYGDCKPDLPVAYQTPVPGGVGLLTRLCLLENLMEAYKNGI